MENIIVLEKKISITGQIIAKTGMHIGGSNTAMNIGGPDKFVVRNPIDLKPYIPGSSLKGKLRSLLECLLGEMNIERSKKRIRGEEVFINLYKATNDPKHMSGKLFGRVGDYQQPSRLIVRDSYMISEEMPNTDLLYTETKTEVSIDRITAEAKPRTFERVPAGVVFGLEMILNIYSEDNEVELISSLKTAINLLQDDCLGGHGSRGYGQIEIQNLKFEDRDKSWYENNLQ